MGAAAALRNASLVGVSVTVMFCSRGPSAAIHTWLSPIVKQTKPCVRLCCRSVGQSGAHLKNWSGGGWRRSVSGGRKWHLNLLFHSYSEPSFVTKWTLVPIRQFYLWSSSWVLPKHYRWGWWGHQGFSSEFLRKSHFEMFTGSVISTQTVFQEEGSCSMSRQVEASVVPCLACSTCHCRNSSSSNRFPFTSFSTAIICHRSLGKERRGIITGQRKPQLSILGVSLWLMFNYIHSFVCCRKMTFALVCKRFKG